MSKLLNVLRDELYGLHLPLLLARFVSSLFPPYVGSRFRASLFRLAGLQLGQGTLLWGTPLVTGDRNMHTRLLVGEGCWINLGCVFDTGAEIVIGNHVAFGQQVMILTTSHEIGDATRRAGPVEKQPVTIGDGAWVGARSTILPGVTIGAGAIVAAGSVVTKSVAPNQLVAGVPARPLRSLNGDEFANTRVEDHSEPSFKRPTTVPASVPAQKNNAAHVHNAVQNMAPAGVVSE